MAPTPPGDRFGPRTRPRVAAARTGAHTGRVSSEVPAEHGRRQPDRVTRLELAVARDGPGCFWCGRHLGGLVAATTDHVVPRVKGGPSWLENEVAACRRCNGERGHLGPVEWLEECRRRGWPARSSRWPGRSPSAAVSAGPAPTWTRSCAGCAAGPTAHA